MNRISLFLVSIAAMAAMASCSSEDPLPQGSLVIEGVYNDEINLGAIEGDWRKFTITSQYDWEIPSGDGFYCTPDHGSAGRYEIIMTAGGTSSSIYSTKLGGLVIRVKSTRFVGITVYQNPLVEITGGTTLTLEANDGSSAELRYSSRAEGISATASGDIECVQPGFSVGNLMYTVTSKVDNYTLSDRQIGTVRFLSDGVELDGEVRVMQRKAISCTRETVLIAGYKGAEATFKVSSPFALTAVASGSGYTASYDGTAVVTVKATDDNDTDREKELGYVRIQVAGNTDCHTDVEVRQRAHFADQTLMFYFNGTYLESYYRTNRTDIMKGVTEKMLEHNRVLMFVQDTPTYGSVYELSFNSSKGAVQMDHVRDFTLTPEYDSKNLKEILQFMTSSAPADRYGMTFSSHGLGWIPKSGKRGTFSATSHETLWRKVPGALDTRYVGDSTTLGYDTTELAEAIESTGVTLDYVIFDACFMGNIEAIYDLRNVVSHVMASPCEIMGKGLPYDLILQYLIRDDGSYDLDSAARTSVEYYEGQSTKSCCLAVTDCSKVERVAAALKAVNSAAVKSYDISDIQAYEGVSVSWNPSHVFFDLEDVYIHTCSDAQALADFSAELDGAVGSRYHTDAFYSAYNGRMNEITHYCGVSTSDLSKAYPGCWEETAWYKATH